MSGRRCTLLLHYFRSKIDYAMFYSFMEIGADLKLFSNSDLAVGGMFKWIKVGGGLKRCLAIYAKPENMRRKQSRRRGHAWGGKARQ